MSVSNADVLRVTMNSSAPGASTIQNVWHFVASTATSIEDTAVLDALEAWLINAFTPILGELSDEWNPLSALVYNITEEMEVGEIPLVGGIVPTGAGAALPPGVAALLTFATNVPRRQGKKYLAGMSEESYDNGTWDGPAQTALAESAALMLLPAEVEAFVLLIPVVYSVGFEVGSAIASAIVRNLPAYQRRRKEGVGF